MTFYYVRYTIEEIIFGGNTMSSHYGNKFAISLFGDAESSGIGVIIEGLPVGLSLDTAALTQQVGPFKILSGVHNGKTGGTPLTALFPPTSAPETDMPVPVQVLRPGFADIGEYKKSGAHPELRGGGHLAEQAITPILFAGALAEQLLKTRHIDVYSHIFSIGEVQDESYEAVAEPERVLGEIKGELPVMDKRKEMLMKLKIAQTENAGDTVGGQIEAAVLRLPAGLGDPIFAGLKSKISALLFSLPRVTAVEFGTGTGSSLMNGSAYNDIPFVDTLKGQISTRTNHCGGVQGGISNGMPLLVRATFAPSPAVAVKQPTVHRSEQRDVTLPPFVGVQACDMPTMCKLVKAALAITIVDTLS